MMPAARIVRFDQPLECRLLPPSAVFIRGDARVDDLDALAVRSLGRGCRAERS
jgi:hypothetical protein